MNNTAQAAADTLGERAEAVREAEDEIAALTAKKEIADEVYEKARENAAEKKKLFDQTAKLAKGANLENIPKDALILAEPIIASVEATPA